VRGSSRLLGGALAALIVGVAVLLLAEAEVLRVAATMSLLAFIALGVFAIATPEFATGDRDEEIDAPG
jgi:hypothetical protein